MRNHINIVKNTRIIVLSFMTAISLWSCKSFIQVELPSNQLTNEIVFQDAATADAAILYILGKLRGDFPGSANSLAGTTRSTALYSDELLPHLSFEQGTHGQFYQNNVLPDNAQLLQVWTDAYSLIFAVNSVIEGVEKSSVQAINAESKQKLIGESLFLRAFINLTLTQLFGDIPYITSTDYQSNKTAKRTERGQVLSNLVSDLETAIDYLPNSYNVPERIRPNAWVAQALLARVYLYMEEWEKAEEISTTLIDNPLFSLRGSDEIDVVFHKDSPETIWQFGSSEANYPTNEANMYYFTTAPSSSFSINPKLVESFSLEDKRLDAWILPVSDNQGNTFYYMQKYKNRVYGANSTELSVQFRLAEQYLIRAESRIRTGAIATGRTDLNRIRERAGLIGLTSDVEGVLLDELLRERQRELFLEYPHRLFDVVRMGRTEIFETNKSGWDDHDKLWPLPEKELEWNPHLKPQNQGYN